jgi:hypothetical protein
VAVAVALVLGLVLAQPAGAIVPPKNCGMMTVKGKRYQIKADQMRCTPARTYSARYLRTHQRPTGYRCTDYRSGTALKFRCYKRLRVFFAIRR